MMIIIHDSYPNKMITLYSLEQMFYYLDQKKYHIQSSFTPYSAWPR